jgi:hypothetical protein
VDVSRTSNDFSLSQSTPTTPPYQSTPELSAPKRPPVRGLFEGISSLSQLDDKDLDTSFFGSSTPTPSGAIPTISTQLEREEPQSLIIEPNLELSASNGVRQPYALTAIHLHCQH